MINWVKRLFSASSSNSGEFARTLATLEKSLGYRFKNRDLLVASLTHPSYLQDNTETTAHNQRMEFLGDSVLSLILAERLYQIFPNEREGVLAKGRAALAKGAFLSELARELKLGDHLRMSRHEDNTGGKHRASTLEDALEAIVGAIYLDSNYERTRQVVLPWYGDLEKILHKTLAHENPKGKLQESIQRTSPKRSIEYKILEAAGPDHKKVFTVEVIIDGESKGTGTGNSKKEAEESAAREAIKQLGSK